jgi:hypothetical protein
MAIGAAAEPAVANYASGVLLPVVNFEHRREDASIA